MKNDMASCRLTVLSAIRDETTPGCLFLDSVVIPHTLYKRKEDIAIYFPHSFCLFILKKSFVLLLYS